MHDLQTLVSHLKVKLKETGALLENKSLLIGFLQNKETALSTVGTAIKIQVGYSGVQGVGAVSKEDLVSDIEILLGDYTQYILIQFECDAQDVPVVWRALNTAMANYNPINSVEADYSGYFYETGGVKGITNGRYQWQDSWKIGFSFEA